MGKCGYLHLRTFLRRVGKAGRTAVPILIVLSCAGHPVSAASAQPAQGSSASPAAAPSGIVKFTPGMTAGSLAGRPDSDLVEFSNHSRMRVGDLRRFEAAAKKLRQAGAAKPLPPGLRAAPSGAGTKVSNGTEVSAALKRPGNETLQLPSGKRLTADQLRFLRPEIEKQLGRRLDAPATPPSRTGPAIQVSQKTTKAEWKEILRKPDRTVLESPSGKRITVGEIRKAFPRGGESAAPGRSRGGK